MNYFNLEKLGRTRLSENFFMREFLYSEVANYYGISNIPSDIDFAIENGQILCSTILEPLQQQFGRLFIRSGYRSEMLNNFCNRKRLNCASNKRNYARHIWDVRDVNGHAGAMACIVIPAYIECFNRTGSVEDLKHWINNNIEHSEIRFFKNLAAFNIGWKEVCIKK